MAPSWRMAVRAASRAKCSGEWVPSKKSSVTRPPPPEVPRAVAPAPSLPAGVLGDDEDVEAGERLSVGGEGAVGGGDEDAAQLVVEAGADLGDARVEGAGGLVGALDQGELGGDFGVGGGAGDGVKGGLVGGMAEAGHLLLGRAAGDEGCGARGAEEAGRR
jgi:hypothetical protein